MFNRLTRDVIELTKHGNIKNKPNQTKQVKITKTNNINVCNYKQNYVIVNSIFRINNCEGV